MTLVVWWQLKKVDHRNFLSRSKVRIEYRIEICIHMSKSQWETTKRMFFPNFCKNTCYGVDFSNFLSRFKVQIEFEIDAFVTISMGNLKMHFFKANFDMEIRDMPLISDSTLQLFPTFYMNVSRYRYRAIIFPLKPKPSRWVIMAAILAIWVSSALLSLPSILYSRTFSNT